MSATEKAKLARLRRSPGVDYPISSEDRLPVNEAHSNETASESAGARQARRGRGGACGLEATLPVAVHETKEWTAAGTIEETAILASGMVGSFDAAMDAATASHHSMDSWTTRGATGNES